MAKRKKPPRRRPGKLGHVNDRTGDTWPKSPCQDAKATGWLTWEEYDLIETTVRWGVTDIWIIGMMMGHSKEKSTSMYYGYLHDGILHEDSLPMQYIITKQAMDLYHLTDEYMLGLEIDE